MFDVDSAAKYTLKVMVEDVTKPIDLNTSLESIPDVKVYEGVSETAIPTAPILIYVVPEGEYDVSKLFTSIEAQTRMYGPPRCRKRKTKVTGWSAQMYPAFVEHKLLALDGMRCALVLLN